MSKDLTNSPIDRQNILNNPYAIREIEKATRLEGIPFEGKTVIVKEQLASFFEVTSRTIDNYLERFGDELRQNGYEVLRGKRLNDLKLAISQSDVHERDFVNIRAPQVGVFDFRAFLNLAMLVTEGDKARMLRVAILDIAMDVINMRTGGGTKYINQRDEEFLRAWYEEENYRKQFTDALEHYLDLGRVKYAIYTNKIYVSIFREKADEYKRVLKLKAKDSARDTFYSEILDLVSAYECGLADELKRESERRGRKLRQREADELFRHFESAALWKPLIEKARNKMASRDLAFRDALHQQLTEYLSPLDASEYERFIGEKSKELSERLEEAKDVFKRLKERD